MALTTLPTRDPADLGTEITDTRTPRANELSAAHVEAIKDRVIEIGTDIGTDSAPAGGSLKARMTAVEATAAAKAAVGAGIVAVGAASSDGVSATAARVDHVHAHGTQAGGSLHADATRSVAGFMPAADVVRLDATQRRLLWRWNGTDVTQFGAQVNYGTITGTVVPTVVASAWGTNLLRITVTSLDSTNAEMAVIPVTGLSLPRRYGVRIRYSAQSFSGGGGGQARGYGWIGGYDSGGSGYGAAILCFDTSANRRVNQLLAGVVSQSSLAAGPTTAAGHETEDDFTLSSLTPTGTPGYNLRHVGRPAASSVVSAVNQNSPALTGTWTGRTLTGFGLAFSASGVFTAWSGTIDIEAIEILTHPDDATPQS
jgi:hypothetical protein